MSESLLAVTLALASALSQAFGTVIRHRTAARPGAAATGRLGVLSSRYWWAGMGISLTGFAFQGFALLFGSLILVQTVAVLSLTFALPLGAWFTGRRVTKTELSWGAVLTACVIVLVVYGRPTGGAALPAWHEWVVACGAGITVVTVLLRLSRGRRRGDQALLLGVAGGTAFAYVALLTKGVADRFAADGLLEVLANGEVYGLAVAAVAALTLQQLSFSAGAVHQAVPASTVTTPVVALALGVVVLGEWFTVNGAEMALLGVTLLVMVVATVSLARKDVRPQRGAGSGADWARWPEDGRGPAGRQGPADGANTGRTTQSRNDSDTRKR